MIDHSKKIIFIHITRTGGTSIESAIGGKDWWLIDPNSKHLSASMTRALYGDTAWNSYFKFSFVRNPWDRIVSMYATGWWFNKLTVEKNGSSYPTMKNFILSHRPHDTEKHGYKFYHDIIDEDLDFIGRYENLEEDFRAICAKTGLSNITFPHEELRYREHYSAYFDDETLELVQDIYKVDIEKFGYCFDRKVPFDSKALLRLQNILPNKQLREWAEDAEQRVAKEQDNTRLAREWAERTDALLLTEREDSEKLRQWAKRSDDVLAIERGAFRQLLDNAERIEQLLEDERHRGEMLQNDLDKLRPFVSNFNYLYLVYQFFKYWSKHVK